MIKSRSEVQNMILMHIREIDNELNKMVANSEAKSQLVNAKSTALQALAQIVTS